MRMSKADIQSAKMGKGAHGDDGLAKEKGDSKHGMEAMTNTMAECRKKGMMGGAKGGGMMAGMGGDK